MTTKASKLAPIADAEAYKPEEFRDWLQIEVRLAKAYWEQSIQTRIVDRKLRDAEFEVVRDAYRRVEVSVQNAGNWNAGNWPLGEDRYNGDDGKKCGDPYQCRARPSCLGESGRRYFQ